MCQRFSPKQSQTETWPKKQKDQPSISSFILYAITAYTYQKTNNYLLLTFVIN
jgi:hypothetical protein